MTARPAADAVLRPATAADLPTCAETWKAGLDDYLARLNQPALPDDLTGVRRLLEHFLATDPELFWVAERDGAIEAFASATVRGDLWFLGMLFVRPGDQGHGLGQRLLDRVLELAPAGVHRRGTATDSAQPISNALYSRRGIVPRVPAWRLVGEILDPDAFPPLPAGVAIEPFARIVDQHADGHRRLADLVNAVDREVLGFEHPADHALLRRDARDGFLLRAASGAPIGYGYASAVGRIGPISALDPAHVAPLLGWLVANVPANGGRAVWIPGSAGEAFTSALRAGLRLDGFPALICWSEPGHPFHRYLPISLALV